MARYYYSLEDIRLTAVRRLLGESSKTRLDRGGDLPVSQVAVLSRGQLVLQDGPNFSEYGSTIRDCIRTAFEKLDAANKAREAARTSSKSDTFQEDKNITIAKENIRRILQATDILCNEQIKNEYSLRLEQLKQRTTQSPNILEQALTGNNADVLDTPEKRHRLIIDETNTSIIARHADDFWFGAAMLLLVPTLITAWMGVIASLAAPALIPSIVSAITGVSINGVALLGFLSAVNPIFAFLAIGAIFTGIALVAYFGAGAMIAVGSRASVKMPEGLGGDAAGDDTAAEVSVSGALEGLSDGSSPRSSPREPVVTPADLYADTPRQTPRPGNPSPTPRQHF